MNIEKQENMEVISFTLTDLYFFMPFLQQTGSSQLIDYTIMLLSLTVVQSTPFLKVDKDGIGYIRYRIQIRNNQIKLNQIRV